MRLEWVCLPIALVIGMQATSNHMESRAARDILRCEAQHTEWYCGGKFC